MTWRQANVNSNSLLTLYGVLKALCWRVITLTYNNTTSLNLSLILLFDTHDSSNGEKISTI